VRKLNRIILFIAPFTITVHVEYSVFMSTTSNLISVLIKYKAHSSEYDLFDPVYKIKLCFVVDYYKMRRVPVARTIDRLLLQAGHCPESSIAFVYYARRMQKIRPRQQKSRANIIALNASRVDLRYKLYYGVIIKINPKIEKST